MNAVVRLFKDAEKLRNGPVMVRCESCVWWSKRKRGTCSAPVPWWVDADMPEGVPCEEHMPPKTVAHDCEMYLPNNMLTVSGERQKGQTP